PLPLTRTRSETEWNAVFSPDGNRIAYTSGRNRTSSVDVSSRSMNIFTLNLTTHEVTQVTTRRRGANYLPGLLTENFLPLRRRGRGSRGFVGTMTFFPS